MNIKDADFKGLVDALFGMQNGEFNHIYEKEKVKRFKELCKNKKLIVLGTGYYLKVLPKFLKLTYDVDIYGVYDWVAERESGDGIFANCKDYDYLDLQKYNKYKDKINLVSKDEFYSDPENTVIFINSESFLYMPFFLYYNGFKYYYSMRNLGKNLLSKSFLDNKATEFAMYDINELNHIFTTPEISRIVTLYNLLSDEKSKEVYKAALKFKLTEDYSYLIDIKDDLKKQYFDKVVKFSDEEVFVDCGGYTGDTIEAFIKAVNGKFKQIYSFEPDGKNYKILTEYINTLEQKDKIKAIDAGVYYKSSAFYLQGKEMAIACTNQATDRKVEVCAIDDIVKIPPTYIKMDIETFETYALLGAMESIIKHKPKLAISIYHKFDDLWNIPLLLKQWAPEYQLYIRHYECYQAETVVYAIPNV